MKYVSKAVGISGLDSLVEDNYTVSVGYVYIGLVLRSTFIKTISPNKRCYKFWFDPIINYWCSNGDGISRDLSLLIDNIRRNEAVK